MLHIIIQHTIIHLVREAHDVELDAQLGNLGQFVPGEDFADGVVWRIDDDGFCFGSKGLPELGKVDGPVGAGGDAGGGCGWVEGDVDGVGALEFDGCKVLVKEGFEEDDFFAWVDVGDQCGVRAWGSAKASARKRKDSLPQFAPAEAMISVSFNSLPSLTRFSNLGEKWFFNALMSFGRPRG